MVKKVKIGQKSTIKWKIKQKRGGEEGQKVGKEEKKGEKGGKKKPENGQNRRKTGKWR